MINSKFSLYKSNSVCVHGERFFGYSAPSGEHEAYRIRYQNEIWHEIADKIGFCLEYHTFILSYEGDMNMGWIFFWRNISIYISCIFHSTGVFQSHIQMLGCGAHVRKIALPHVRCACGKVFGTVRAMCVRAARFWHAMCDPTFAHFLNKMTRFLVLEHPFFF